MLNQINKNNVDSGLSQSVDEAETLLKDKEKLDSKLNEAMKKAESSRGALQKVWHDLQLFFSIISDYFSGRYKIIPVGSITLIVAAILYFLLPIDAIPDFIPFAGYLDDITVIGIVVNQVASDLEEYEKWKKGN